MSLTLITRSTFESVGIFQWLNHETEKPFFNLFFKKKWAFLKTLFFLKTHRGAWIWVDISYKSIGIHDITITNQTITKPCAYFMRYTLYNYHYWKVRVLPCVIVIWNNRCSINSVLSTLTTGDAIIHLICTVILLSTIFFNDAIIHQSSPMMLLSTRILQ